MCGTNCTTFSQFSYLLSQMFDVACNTTTLCFVIMLHQHLLFFCHFFYVMPNVVMRQLANKHCISFCTCVQGKHAYVGYNIQVALLSQRGRAMLHVCRQLASILRNVFYCQLRRLQIYHCVQLNALFCCLWRNVEAFCHKHFVVFSRNQHRRLLPATCHNLQDGGRCPPATVFTAPGMLQR